MTVHQSIIDRSVNYLIMESCVTVNDHYNEFVPMMEEAADFRVSNNGPFDGLNLKDGVSGCVSGDMLQLG